MMRQWYICCTGGSGKQKEAKNLQRTISKILPFHLVLAKHQLISIMKCSNRGREGEIESKRGRKIHANAQSHFCYCYGFFLFIWSKISTFSAGSFHWVWEALHSHRHSLIFYFCTSVLFGSVRFGAVVVLFCSLFLFCHTFYYFVAVTPFACRNFFSFWLFSHLVCLDCELSQCYLFPTVDNARVKWIHTRARVTQLTECVERFCGSFFFGVRCIVVATTTVTNPNSLLLPLSSRYNEQFIYTV